MSNFILGLDLGQASQFSALCVLETSEAVAEPKPLRHYAARHIQRWVPGTGYPAIVADVAALLGTPALHRSRLILGITGVGKPVLELFRRAKLPVQLEPVIVTAGQGENVAKQCHHVSKVILVADVQVLLQQRRLQFAKDLPDVPALVQELQDYRTRMTQPTMQLLDPREAPHDDLVLALALGCWWGERKKKEVRWW